MSNAYILGAGADLVIGIKDHPAPRSPVILAWVRGPFDPYLWNFDGPAQQQAYGWLVNPQTGLVIAVESPGVSGASLELTERRRDDSQLWAIEAVADEPGSYYIVGASGLVMDVRNPETAGMPVRAVKRTRARGEWWKVLTAPGHPARPPIRPAGATVGHGSEEPERPGS